MIYLLWGITYNNEKAEILFAFLSHPTNTTFKLGV